MFTTTFNAFNKRQYITEEREENNFDIGSKNVEFNFGLIKHSDSEVHLLLINISKGNWGKPVA